ncbi:hypothetical protein J3B02_001024 [Coemansia erecta]|uniref:Uncharacterized protein n=1 Tax=Coemansia asiatica TaxID=1052880 RepID=A0A9W7XNV4_9FUNG|nr:hypothetical protein LPJ64_001518 [Coemansia asiatica]KAJ2853235.1 hypothetical protein FB639_006573 [Coemansia asiatica]KAJ2857395.1 hypothetical protein J3B02_001024 [Coemansia erecta]
MAASQIKVGSRCGSTAGGVGVDVGGAPRKLSSLSSLPKRAKATRIAMGRHLCVTEPVPWQEVKNAIDSEDVEPLGRSVEMQTIYQKYVAHVNAEYGSVASYLMQHALADFIGQGLSANEDENFLFWINEFPYSLGDGVEHWVLWSRRQLQPGFVPPETAVRVIKAKFGNSAEWRYFVNAVAKQSVPQLSHAHVLVKRAQASIESLS